MELPKGAEIFSFLWANILLEDFFFLAKVSGDLMTHYHKLVEHSTEAELTKELM